MQRHPVKHELLSYAESLVGGRPIPAELGRHVARCQACAAEVAAMRESLRVAAAAKTLEPSREFTARVLLAAKNERVSTRRHRSRMRSALAVAKGFGYAASLVAVSAWWFTAASVTAPAAAAPVAEAPQPVAMAAQPSPEEVREVAAQIQTFAAAVGALDGQPVSLRELQHRRMALALNADLAEALSALAQNPGCERANDLMTTTLRRQAKNWKNLYLLERSL